MIRRKTRMETKVKPILVQEAMINWNYRCSTVGGMDSRSLAVGIIVGLVIGLTVEYAATSTMVDLERLEQEISQLEEKVNLLVSQIHEKDDQIANLQSLIEELEASVLPVEKSIEIEADGEILYYKETKLWDKGMFLKLIEDEREFESSQITEFYETYSVEASNFSVECDKEKSLTVLKCDIHASQLSWCDFHWFLNRLGVDFVDSGFMKSEETLCWEGYVQGVPVTITLRFPFTIEHCHAHVWRK